MTHRKCCCQHSAVLLSKYRLKCAVTTQFLLVLLMAFRLSVAIYVMIGIRPPRTLQKLRFPAAKNWEIIWLLGNVVTCLVGMVALLRNRPTLVRFYSAGESDPVYTIQPVVKRNRYDNRLNNRLIFTRNYVTVRHSLSAWHR